MLQLTELVTPWSFFVSRNTPDFISSLLWPPNRPDRNLVDCEVWGVLQQRVYHSRIRDIDHLKQCHIEEWRCFDQNIIDRTVWQWRVRLRACVRANGGYFDVLVYALLRRLFHIGNFCFWVTFLKQLLLRNCSVNFVDLQRLRQKDDN